MYPNRICRSVDEIGINVSWYGSLFNVLQVVILKSIYGSEDLFRVLENKQDSPQSLRV